MPPSHHNTAPKSALSPELKAWLDNVVVPALLKEYLAESACSEGEPVAEFAATRTAIAEEGR